jgi:hypothetical protein
MRVLRIRVSINCLRQRENKPVIPIALVFYAGRDHLLPRTQGFLAGQSGGDLPAAGE